MSPYVADLLIRDRKPIFAGEMKRMKVIFAALCSIAALSVMAGNPLVVEDNPPVKRMVSDSVVVINTTALGKNIIGYSGATPVEIYVTNGRVSQIKPLPNMESPGYFWTVVKSGLFSMWNGLTPEEAKALKVDAVSGSTFSSDAVIRNVRAGLKYLDEQR